MARGVSVVAVVAAVVFGGEAAVLPRLFLRLRGSRCILVGWVVPRAGQVWVLEGWLVEVQLVRRLCGR